MTNLRRLVVIILIFTLSAYSGTTALAQDDPPNPATSEYFYEKGHYLSGDFLAFYRANPEAEILYGYPITGAYYDQKREMWVQYFERALFVLDTTAPPELRVRVFEIGYYLPRTGFELSIPNNFPACEQFIETNYQVCYTFLDFFEAHGGAAQFGYPISNFEIKGRRIVQYFQKARFEWHPENPPGERVVLSDLGRIYFTIRGEDPSRLLPETPPPVENAIPRTILNLRVRAYPTSAVLSRDGLQTIYVIVQDQRMLAVEGVEIRLHITWANGEVERHIIPGSTDENGVIYYSFDYDNKPQGLAQIVVTANAPQQHLQAKTITSFRIWQ